MKGDRRVPRVIFLLCSLRAAVMRRVSVCVWACISPSGVAGRFFPVVGLLKVNVDSEAGLLKYSGGTVWC